MKITLFSDLHLGVKGDSQEWHTIAAEWIDTFINELKKKNIKNVFFLGDWFNNRTSICVSTLHLTTQILDKFKDFNLYIFSGNHDLFFSQDSSVSSVSIFKGYPNVKYIDKITKITMENTDITLCPWGFNPLDENVENSKYLFGHFEINTFQMNSSEQLCENGLKLSDLFKKFNMIFSGHFHKAQKRVYGVGTVQYVGNPFQINYGEGEDEKGYIILNLETDKYNFVYNYISPKFIKLSLSQLITISPSEIKDKIYNNYLRLSVDKNITVEDMDELIKLLSSCKPRECNIDWDNNNFSSNVKTNTDYSAIELITALKEYVNLIDIDNPKEIISYLATKYKEASE